MESCVTRSALLALDALDLGAGELKRKRGVDESSDDAPLSGGRDNEGRGSVSPVPGGRDSESGEGEEYSLEEGDVREDRFTPDASAVMERERERSATDPAAGVWGRSDSMSRSSKSRSVTPEEERRTRPPGLAARTEYTGDVEVPLAKRRKTDKSASWSVSEWMRWATTSPPLTDIEEGERVQPRAHPDSPGLPPPFVDIRHLKDDELRNLKFEDDRGNFWFILLEGPSSVTVDSLIEKRAAWSDETDIAKRGRAGVSLVYLAKGTTYNKGLWKKNLDTKNYLVHGGDVSMLRKFEKNLIVKKPEPVPLKDTAVAVRLRWSAILKEEKKKKGKEEQRPATTTTVTAEAPAAAEEAPAAAEEVPAATAEALAAKSAKKTKKTQDKPTTRTAAVKIERKGLESIDGDTQVFHYQPLSLIMGDIMGVIFKETSDNRGFYLLKEVTEDETAIPYKKAEDEDEKKKKKKKEEEEEEEEENVSASWIPGMGTAFKWAAGTTVGGGGAGAVILYGARVAGLW